MAALLEKWLAFEQTFNTQDAINYTMEHTEIPVFAVCIYLAIVFYFPEYSSKSPPLKLRNAWAFWNLLLSIFSCIGMYKTLPTLLSALSTNGFHYTTCEAPQNWFLRYDQPNPCGLWVTLFIYSKIPELLDTVFLVLQKKPVIFLHWFHHVTVLLYCWHAFSNWTASGLWFVAMNFSVHSVMYFYYFLSISGFKLLARPLAPLITSIQMTQMIVGCVVTWNTARTSMAGEECAVDKANYKLGLAMYLSYFTLFAILFYNLYMKPGGKHTRKSVESNDGMKKVESDVNLCGVDIKSGDAAGFFHTRSEEEKKKMKDKRM